MKTKRVSGVSVLRRASPDLRRRVVDAATALFLGRGFARVTAADIAAELGISKATLYKAFASKEEILKAVVRGMRAGIAARVTSLVRDPSLGFVEKMVGLLSFLAAQMARLEPVFVRDLQRSAPAVWAEIDDFRKDMISQNLRPILEAGRREGFFRADVDPELLVGMFLSLVRDFINPAAVVRSGRSPAATFEAIIKVFFQGILTDKGRLDFASRTPALFEPRKEGAL